MKKNITTRNTILKLTAELKKTFAKKSDLRSETAAVRRSSCSWILSCCASARRVCLGRRDKQNEVRGGGKRACVGIETNTLSVLITTVLLMLAVEVSRTVIIQA